MDFGVAGMDALLATSDTPTPLLLPCLSYSKRSCLLLSPSSADHRLPSILPKSNAAISCASLSWSLRLPPSSRSRSLLRSVSVDVASPSSTTHWMVVVETLPNAGSSVKSEIIDFYVKILASVLGNEKQAQMCIYNASWRTHFGFCCDIEEESAKQLARLPGVLSVKPDPNFESVEKDNSFSNSLLGDLLNQNASLGNSKYWIVRMASPGVEVVTKAQMVDYYAQTLTKVLGNEKDAQVCMYHVSWQNNYGFCCVVDEECARELLYVPGVLSVQPDTNAESDNKNYKGDGVTDLLDSSDTSNIKTKRLFVTGLSFYTSEKTLRAAFEGFGELVEVKIIMDKISKRSKGYAFIEYTTEEAAGAALREMNGKIINGWMIVVDVAKKNPPKYSQYRPTGAL